MSKIVTLFATKREGKSLSVRTRKPKAMTGLRKTNRLTHLDALAYRLGYQLVRGKSVMFRYTATLDREENKVMNAASPMAVPRVKKMTFTQACDLSKDLFDSREERLKSVSFDGPE